MKPRNLAAAARSWSVQALNCENCLCKKSTCNLNPQGQGTNWVRMHNAYVTKCIVPIAKYHNITGRK